MESCIQINVKKKKSSLSLTGTQIKPLIKFYNTITYLVFCGTWSYDGFHGGEGHMKGKLKSQQVMTIVLEKLKDR